MVLGGCARAVSLLQELGWPWRGHRSGGQGGRGPSLSDNWGTGGGVQVKSDLHGGFMAPARGVEAGLEAQGRCLSCEHGWVSHLLHTHTSSAGTCRCVSSLWVSGLVPEGSLENATGPP